MNGIIKNARQLIGEKFYYGNINFIGNDCLGIIYKLIQEKLTVEQKNYLEALLKNYYSQYLNTDVLSIIRQDSILFKNVDIPRVGDIAVYHFRDFPVHFALISNLDPLTIIHSSSLIGYVVENTVDEYWFSRLLCYLRLYI